MFHELLSIFHLYETQFFLKYMINLIHMRSCCKSDRKPDSSETDERNSVLYAALKKKVSDFSCNEHLCSVEIK